MALNQSKKLFSNAYLQQGAGLCKNNEDAFVQLVS